MKAKKFYYVMVGVIVIFIGATGATIYFGNVMMQKSAQKLMAVKLDNVIADYQEQSYLQSKKDLEKYKDLNETIQKILPKTKDQALAVRELYKIGDETGILVDKIQFPTSTLGQITKPASNSTSGSSTPTQAPKTPALTQAKAVDGMPGVLGIDIEISLQPARGKTISYDNMIKFLQKVEENRRNMQIKRISVTSDPINGGITFSATLTIFVKP